MRVIHYSKDSDFTIKPIVIKNGALPIKPYGGIWASPEDSRYRWTEWCNAEQFGDLEKKYKIILEIDIERFITIDVASDLEKLPWYTISGFIEMIDFEKLKKEEVDGIFLTEHGQEATRFSRFLGGKHDLYGWDCESILIMNERCIKKVIK
jgi:hypothetical protein